MDIVHHIIIQYGYLGIFGLLMFGIIGLPVPDETLLAFCGYLAYKGEFHPLLVILAALLGSCSGISVSYLLGRGPGLALIKRYGKYVHVTEERLDRAHQWFEKVGKWLLVIGYFVPGLRHLTAAVAGSSKLRYPEFAPFAYAGALLWSSTFVAAGYFFGEEWEQMSGKARHFFFVGAGILLALGVAWWLLRQRTKKREQKEAS